MNRRWDAEIGRLRARLEDEFPAIEVDGLNDERIAYSGDDDEIGTVELVRRDMRPPLFDYQKDLVDEVVSRVGFPGAVLLALPTGAGKTRTAVAAVLEGIGNDSCESVAWLAPTVELIDQAIESFESLFVLHGSVERLTLARDWSARPRGPHVVFTTPQAVYARLRERPADVTWDVVVFDEAHQLGARTFRSAVKSLTEYSGEGAPQRSGLLLGLSATPGRVSSKETEDLVDLFDGQLLTSDRLRPNPVRALQRRGVLSMLRFSPLTASDVPLGDEAERLRIGIRACRELVARGRRVLVFAASVPGAKVLAGALSSLGIGARAVDSAMSRVERRTAITDFRDGRVEVLANQRLLATGYDCPAVSDVIILGRVTSPVLFEQMVGRAARGPRTGGSRRATVWDFDDHLLLHGLPQSYYRYRDFDWA